MKCPKCVATLEPVTFHGIEVDRCTSCQGLWFDEFEKDNLAAMKGAEVIDIGKARLGRLFNQVDRILCPRCESPMIRMVDLRQKHIWFEHCPVCGGAFFDAGEFRDLKSHTLMDFFRDLGMGHGRP